MASCFGLDTKGNQESEPSTKKETSSMLFGDPKDYEDMPEEERQKLTEKMLPKYKLFAGESFVHGDPKKDKK